MNKYRLDVNPSAYYAAQFRREGIEVFPYRPAGSPPYKPGLYLRERAEQGVITIKGPSGFASLPTEQSRADQGRGHRDCEEGAQPDCGEGRRLPDTDTPWGLHSTIRAAALPRPIPVPAHTVGYAASPLRLDTFAVTEDCHPHRPGC